MWFEVILMWFECDLAPCLLLTLCMREESALGMLDVLSGKCCLLCLLWMLLSWRESAFELCAFGGKWLSNLLLAGCAFWSDVWCLCRGVMPLVERMESCREVAFLISCHNYFLYSFHLIPLGPVSLGPVWYQSHYSCTVVIISAYQLHIAFCISVGKLVNPLVSS